MILDHNQLSELPTEIGQLAQLTMLNLGYNQLTSLPVEIGQLTQLTKLDLDYNELTSLPAEIGNMFWLTELHLDYNFLTSLPDNIRQLLGTITLLNLRENLLSEHGEGGTLGWGELEEIFGDKLKL